MAGTLAQARVQLQNAESSILFMQQEHAKTLQGLYAEISKLQKKCGGMDCYVVTGKICVRFRVNYVSLYFIELTFKLAMNATSSSGDEGNVDKGNSILVLGYPFQSRQMFSVS